MSPFDRDPEPWRDDDDAEVSRDVADEIAHHLAARAQDLTAEGLTPAEAEARARREFGDVERARRRLSRAGHRHHRRRRVCEMLRNVARDVQLGLRRLAREPLFSLTAGITLALGIGASSAVFSLVDGVLLRPLGFADADRLMVISHTGRGAGREDMGVSTGTFLTYLDKSRTLEDLGLWDNADVTVTGTGDPARLPILLVSDHLLDVLRVQPALGRPFREDDAIRGAPPIAIVADGYWRTQLGGDPAALGRNLTVNGTPVEIVGVLPASFRFPGQDPAFLLPFPMDRASATVGRFQSQAIGRARPGLTADDVRRELTQILPLATDTYGDWDRARLAEIGLTPTVTPLKDQLLGDAGRSLWLVFAAVGLLLAIACANVANLILVRAERRARELAVRAALGATRVVVARQLVIESAALAVVAFPVGLALAVGGVRALRLLGSTSIPRLEDVALNGRALAFATGLTLLAALVSGIVSVVRHSRPDLQRVLASGGRVSARQGAWNALAIGQVALATVLVIGAGLMVRSFGALRNVAPGYRAPEELLTFRLFISSRDVPNLETAIRRHQAILEAIRAIPGVTAASVANSLPMDGRNNNNSVYVESSPEGDAAPPSRRHKFVVPGFFQAMGNPLLAGRDITWDDVFARRAVAVVTANFAREYWPTPGAALGQRIREGRHGPWKEIVGVVGDEHDDGLARPATTVLYWPILVSDFWGMREFGWRSVAYVVRAPNSLGLLPEIRRRVWSVDPNLPLADVRTMADIGRATIARTTFTLAALAVAAAIALGLGVVGLYAVLASMVAAQTRAIGIRMAVGANRRRVIGMVLGRGLGLAAIGLVLGITSAVALSRLLGAVLYEVEPLDPATYAVAGGVLLATAVAAGLLPARRAAGLSPIETLRAE